CFDLLVEQAEIDGAALQQRLTFGGGRASLSLTVNNAPIFIEVTIGPNQRIGHIAAVNFERWHDVANDAETIGLVRRKRLAEQARDHRLFAADHVGQKVGRPADRGRTVLGAGLAKASEILRNREVAGHADFLAATDTHSIHTTNNWLVTAKDGRDHVVEESHVPPVFLGTAGIVLGVLLSISTGAKRLITGSGENDGDNIAGGASLAERKNHTLDHLGCVGIELGRVIERDPRIVEVRDGLAVFAFRRPLFVAHTLVAGKPNLSRDQSM